MNKVFLSGVLLVSAFLTSCGSDDDGNENGVQENSAPNEAVLAISEESGLSIDLTWDEVTDIDGDVVTYDLYANDVIVAADLTEVDYTWSAEGQDDVVYPIVFTVVSKDINGGEAISNEVELDDPIIGEWDLILFADILDDDGTLSEFMSAEEIGECDGEDSFVLTSDGSYVGVNQDIEDDICFSQTIEGKWENVGNQNYSFIFTDEDEVEVIGEIFFVFEGDTFNFLSSDSSFIYERR